MSFKPQGYNEFSIQKPREKTYEEIQAEKQKLLFGLERLQKQGYPECIKRSGRLPPQPNGSKTTARNRFRRK